MPFFDKIRKKRNSDPLMNEIKRVFKEKAIQLSDEDITEIYSGFPNLQTGKCICNDGRMIIHIGDQTTYPCPTCGRIVHLTPMKMPKGSLTNELKDNIAGIGHFKNGLNHLKVNNLKEAIDSFTKAILLKPEYTDAYYNRGESRIGTGDFSGAIEDCDKVIQLQPNDADAFINRGSAKAQLGDYNGCLSDTNKAIELGYTKPVAFLNRGLCFLEIYQVQEAVKALQTFIELAPNDPRVPGIRAKIKLLNFRTE